MKQPLLIFLCLVVFAACDTGGGDEFRSAELWEYQSAGENVRTKEYTENYDCSNFSTQFYQNCYKAGLPCRVRLGQSGGDNFMSGDHAWNSVKINGIWVDWEPQLNDVYDGHRRTNTPVYIGWNYFTKEDIARIIYENIGKNVPEDIIDKYEIDTYWNNNSPFYKYFVSKAMYLDDTQVEYEDLISTLEKEIPADNSGDIFIVGGRHLIFFFKYNNKYYAIENLEETDPVEGRSTVKRNILDECLNQDSEFIKTNINLLY